MVVFVAGRFLQGLGAGGITVALYVLIAKVYPAGLHIKIFSAFAAAWVLPSMVGPFVAGVVTDVFSWHWVFLGVVVLVAASTAMLVPAVRRIEHQPPRGPAFDARRVAAAVVVALAVVVVSSSTEWDPRIAWITAPLMIVVIAFAARPLLPAGTYCVRSGLPSVVVLSAAAGAVFFGTEVYLPLLLHDRYGLPAWLSGITLTAAAVSWALASAVQGRLGERLSAAVALRWGASLLVAGVVTQLVTAAGGLSPVVAAAGWFVAGAGMGTMYPRISTLILAHSEPGQEGFNTAAKSISESIGGSVSLALTGLIFALLGDAATRTPYVGVLVFTSVIAVAGVLLAGRAGVRSAR
jgi:MFS family permease